MWLGLWLVNVALLHDKSITQPGFLSSCPYRTMATKFKNALVKHIMKLINEIYNEPQFYICDTSLDKSMLLLNSWYLNLILGVLTCFPEQNLGRKFSSPLHLHLNIRTVTSTLVTALKAAAPCSSASLWLDPKLTFSLMSDSSRTFWPTSDTHICQDWKSFKSSILDVKNNFFAENS